MQASMNPEATFVLISIALRSGYAIGLHRWLDGFGLSESELEQRQLVFWVAYTLEKSMCFRIGRPSAINDEDIGVPIPSESLLEGRSMGISIPSNPGRKFYTFRATCFIALIESRVCSELYSARSWMRSPNERLQRVSRLDQELQEWKDSIPIELRPEETIQCARDQRFAALMLQFSYYNCMTAIHRVSIHHGSWTSTENVPTQVNTPRSRGNPENSRIYASYALCISAARSTVHLSTQFLCLDNDPRNSLIWLAIYFPITACLTLFTHVLQSPLDPRIESDVELMERTLTYLGQSLDVGMETVGNVVSNAFGELPSIARDYIRTVRAGNERQGETFEHQNLAQLPSPPNDQQPSNLAYTGGQGQNLLHGRMDDGRPLSPGGYPRDFEFPPFDTCSAHPDSTLLFGHIWDQFDYSMVDPDWDFVEMGNDDI
jgi:Fungal specific transcription factor domain